MRASRAITPVLAILLAARLAAGQAQPSDEPPWQAFVVAGGADQRAAREALEVEGRTGQRFGDDMRDWRKWIWGRTEAPHANYPAFKAEVYARIDPIFRTFFPSDVKSAIRLDEVDWGGVTVNGIPPLRSPTVIPASEAAGCATGTSSSGWR